MHYRHEWKHEISYSDLLVLRQRLRAAASPDVHSKNGSYLIKSLYFDTPKDRALKEKVDGVNRREKFRIRLYDNDTSFIRIEKKSKLNSLCSKQSARLSSDEVRKIIEGDTAFLIRREEPLLKELYSKMKCQLLRPKTIVQYRREAFVYAPGNVRVTFDYDIRTGLSCLDFLNPDAPLIAAGDAPIILEVKWDEFLPNPIRNAVQLHGRRSQAFSKYAAARIYG